MPFQSFLSMDGWVAIYQSGQTLRKLTAFGLGFLRRLSLPFQAWQVDFILIHRELTPFGPPIFEWILVKILRKKIIYDFDDAIWLTDLENESRLWQWLKWRSKVASICKWSWKVSVGNQYLADYASQYCKNVVLLPTVVDTSIHIPISQQSTANSQQPVANSQRPIIGWTGSHSTLFYLNAIIPILQDLENQQDFEFRVIANRDPKIPLKNYRFVPWSSETEIADLGQLDIGIMPLEDSEWAKGKCGFKLIQYMALSIPAIASPVGVNTQLIEHGVTGFLAKDEEEWSHYLKMLLEDAALRARLGEAGRTRIENGYSLESQKQTFISLFN